HADRSFMEDGEPQAFRRSAAMGAAVGADLDWVRAAVLDLLSDGEHVFVVEREDEAEFEPGAIVPAERQRLARRQALAVGGPDRVLVGYLDGGVLGDPAEIDEIGVDGPGRRQQVDVGALRVDRRAEIRQDQTVGPTTLARDRARAPGR